MSLSQEPAISALRQYFVCGYKDITGESYAGVSGVHNVDGNAVRTTNGAGPHNIQMFMLASDGTVLNCLPGYWSPQDLVREMSFAADLNRVYQNTSLSRTQKEQMFQKMHLAHISQHPQGMHRRSHLQGFDAEYEAKHKLAETDVIRDKNAVSNALAQGWKAPPEAFKAADEILHERMAKRPFLAYQSFDVAQYSDYGLPKYDKHEDYRDKTGMVDHDAAREAPLLGRKSLAHPNRDGSYNQSGPKPWGVPLDQY